MRRHFCERLVTPKRLLDRNSFRTVKNGKATVYVACPKGKWGPGVRCRSGMKAYKVLVPVTKYKRCPRGQRRVTK